MVFFLFSFYFFFLNSNLLYFFLGICGCYLEMGKFLTVCLLMNFFFSLLYVPGKPCSYNIDIKDVINIFYNTNKLTEILSKG